MAWRFIYWWLGFFAVAWIAFRGPDSAVRSERVVVAFAAWLVAGLLAELFSHAARQRQRSRADWSRPLRPADGRPELAHVADAESERNTVDRRFGRLLRLPEAGAHPTTALHQPPLLGGYPRPLRGRVILGSIFLGRDGREWSDAEIARAHGFLWKGAAWLEREARLWEVPLNVGLSELYLAGTDDRQRPEIDLTLVRQEHRLGLFDPAESLFVVAGLRRVVQERYACEVEELVERLAERMDGDHLLWIVHCLSAGRSHYLPEDRSGLRGMPLAVCYARESEKVEPWTGPPFPDPVTFVHELLHVFGASDKYGAPARRFRTAEVSGHDMMLLETESLSRLRIDALTAAEIGWYSGGPLPAGVEERLRRRRPTREGGH